MSAYSSYDFQSDVLYTDTDAPIGTGYWVPINKIPPLTMGNYVLADNTYLQQDYPELFNRLKHQNAFVWTTRTSGTTNGITDVNYGNGLYVYVGDSGTIGTSTDGTTWTLRTSGTTSGFTGLAYGNSTFVAVGSGGMIRYSTDAITWTVATSTTTTFLTSVTYTNNLFFAIGSSNTFLTSTNGITWSNVSIDVVSPININSIVYAFNKYFCLTSGGLLKTSTDLTSWTGYQDLGYPTTSKLSFKNNLLMCLGSGLPGYFSSVYSSNGIGTSTDGVNWSFNSPLYTATNSITYITSNVNTLEYGNNLFVTGSSTMDGYFYISQDAINWQRVKSLTTSNITVVKYLNGLYLYAGAGGFLATSTDSTTPVSISSYNINTHFEVPNPVKPNSMTYTDFKSGSLYYYVRAK